MKIFRNIMKHHLFSQFEGREINNQLQYDIRYFFIDLLITMSYNQQEYRHMWE